MEAKMVGGKKVLVKVSPSEVKQLRDEEIIIVSRAQLNAQLAFTSMNIKNSEVKENIQILNSAIGDMLDQEKKEKSIIMGGRMSVGDVKKIFKKIERMPENSFAQIKI